MEEETYPLSRRQGPIPFLKMEKEKETQKKIKNKEEEGIGSGGRQGLINGAPGDPFSAGLPFRPR